MAKEKLEIWTKKFLTAPNAALRCEQRLAILELSETAKRCESLLNALLSSFIVIVICSIAKHPFGKSWCRFPE
ncbi:hypothetical protein P3700_26465, partial [Vibrio parahaemolyticus]|nr:hypothetical protein [Vibrio parahaemolyticus]